MALFWLRLCSNGSSGGGGGGFGGGVGGGNQTWTMDLEGSISTLGLKQIFSIFSV